MNPHICSFPVCLKNENRACFPTPLAIKSGHAEIGGDVPVQCRDMVFEVSQTEQSLWLRLSG